MPSLQVMFTDPYFAAPHNRHTSPQLDEFARSLHVDADAKRAALDAKAKFIQNRQALLHGDLHTGSCMVTQNTYYVIDTEFAFYGPIAFDVGKFIGNLLLTFFALDGHSSPEKDRSHQRAYLLQVRRCLHLQRVQVHKRTGQSPFWAVHVRNCSQQWIRSGPAT
jgi:5-methylthioribose kinase